VFGFIRDPGNLPRWAHAFKSVQHGKARLETPAGAVDVRLQVLADADCGTVDWRMEFPDGSVGIAQSRVTETARSTSIYSFVLYAPPVPLEEVEGALDTQRVTLRSEQSRLKGLIEG
jgi:hypothetical protein